ncbi:hypothetical protein [Flavobacterium daejeonense]|uniref:hypothetical protein n=1 Tax=Flavobacterium daejeonense TaxID=350893 RepID=UPI0004795773|nr:hypothetical protein [Flavobacterium daejeonense]
MANYNMQKPTHWQGNTQHSFAPFKNDYYARKNGSGSGQRKKDFVKHSGAKHTTYTPEKGNNKGQKQYLTTGWRLNGRELISIRAVTTQKSKESEKGWFGSVAVTFTNTKTGEHNFYWGMMEKRTGKVVVQEMSFVMNPKAKNGGYSGTFIQ